jgi:hypothetical protein
VARAEALAWQEATFSKSGYVHLKIKLRYFDNQHIIEILESIIEK